MLWASVSTAFSSSPKLSRVFLKLDRNTENMFSISFRKYRDEEKRTTCLLQSSKCKFSLFVPSLRQQLVLVLVLNQSACVFALGYFLITI